jgi:hypothetical protein
LAGPSPPPVGSGQPPSQQYNHSSNAYPNCRLSVYFNSPATSPSLSSSVEHHSTSSTTTTSSTSVFVVVPLSGVYPASSDFGCPHFFHLYSHAAHRETPVGLPLASPLIRSVQPPFRHSSASTTTTYSSRFCCCCTAFTSIVTSPATSPSLSFSVKQQSTGSSTTTSLTFVFVVVVPLSDVQPVSSQLRLSSLVPLASLLDWALLRCLLALLRGASCIGRLFLERGS